MERTFTIEEIRNYLLAQDSMGDMLYFLNADNIDEANAEAANTGTDEQDEDDYNHESED